MSNMGTTLTSAPPRDRLPRRSTWVGRHASLPRFKRAGVAGHQSLARDHLAYFDLATDRQRHAYVIVREHHTLTIARVNHPNSALSDPLRPAPKLTVVGWAWVYNTVGTIRLGAKPDTDGNILQAKLALNWTYPYKTIAVSLCYYADNPGRSPLGARLMYLDIPSFPVLMLAGAYRFNAANPVPPPSTVATC